MENYNVSDTNNYLLNQSHYPPQQSYDNNESYAYSKAGNGSENTKYHFKQDNSNDFVGGYQLSNGYSTVTEQKGQNLNNYESTQFVGHQFQTNTTTYDNSSQFQNYPSQSEYYSVQGQQKTGEKYSSQDETNLPKQNDAYQVNSNNHYSQSDRNYDGSLTTETSRSSGPNGEKLDRYDRDHRHRREYKRSRNRSVDSRESYRRHRRRSRSRSYDRSGHRRSHSYRRRRSRSYRRSRSRSYRSGRRHHSYRYPRHRSRSFSRSPNREQEYDYQKDNKNDNDRDPRDIGLDIMEKAKMLRSNEMERRRMKDIEEAQRDDLTVLVSNMHLSVDERDIYELFSEHAGKVRDIQCVRDLRSGRSKGIAYVEFYTQESVIKALSMTGMSMKGQGIRVHSSQAEKNRAAKAAKQLQDNALKESDNPTTIVVSNLLGVLSYLNEIELNQLFSPFGNIIDVALARTDNGESKGYAYIRFKRWNEAKEALNVMNGFDINGQQIKVAYANTRKDPKSRLHSLGDLDMERLDDDDAGLISGSNVKIALMKKLQQRQPLNSSNLVLSNMYTSADYADNHEFFDEIEEDVKEECGKYGTVVQVFVNRRNPDGKVYVKFKNNDDAQSANKSLQGRYFAGNTIQVSYISDDQYQDVVNKS
uniref:RNA splicing factor, putative n=1 Tax=Theileria annulata TaxID=5874 RepID=A0A3B0MWM5_THEAN